MCVIIKNLRYRVVIARLVCSEPVVTDELSQVARGCFGRPWQFRRGKVDIEKAEFFTVSRKRTKNNNKQKNVSIL